VLVLAGCGGRPEPMSGTDAADSSTDPCEGAVFEYRDVCFRAHTVAAIGSQYPAEYPFDLDGEPGDELISVVDDRVSVYRFEGDDFALVAVAEIPSNDNEASGIVVAEFDEVQGLDLIVSSAGRYAALYHLDEAGAPTLVGQTAFAGGRSGAFGGPRAVGPDASGRWRVVAEYENGQNFAAPDPLALWEVQGTELVQVERLDVQSELCEVSDCGGGDFDGDGRTDVVCTISESCSNIQNEYQDQVVLLAQADGTVSAAVYPEKWVQSFVTTDLDGDGITDLVDYRWYRMGDGAGGLGPATRIELPSHTSSGWSLLSAGDLDGNGDVEVVIAEHTRALVFDDIVGGPQTFEMFEVSDASLAFKSAWPKAAVDVNADGIVDLRMQDRTILVSELSK
jgi:hypothetical protein